MQMLAAIFGIVAGISVTLPVVADPPKMVVLELPGLTEADGRGVYADFYRLLETEGLIQSWFSFPLRRAHHHFFDKQVGCIAPAAFELADRYNKGREEFLLTVPFNVAVGKVMFALKPPAQQGQKPVMGVVGFGVQHGVEPGSYRIQAVPDYGKLLSLIEENRIDTAYIVVPDVEQHAGGMERVRNFKGKVETRWEGTDGVLCWGEHKDAVTQITNAIKAWRENGRLKSIFGSYFVE